MKYTKGEWMHTLIGLESKIVDEKVGIIAHLGERSTLAEIEANARLIVSAPKMANLLLYLVNEGWNAGVTEEAREILAEIRGN